MHPFHLKSIFLKKYSKHLPPLSSTILGNYIPMQKLSNKWETSELKLQQEGLQQEGNIKLEICTFTSTKFQFLVAILPYGATGRVMCLYWVQGQTNSRKNGMAPERRSNLHENISASYLYTYLHGTVPAFFKCIREIKKPINLPLFKTHGHVCVWQHCPLQGAVSEKKHKWEPNKQIKVS